MITMMYLGVEIFQGGIAPSVVAIVFIVMVIIFIGATTILPETGKRIKVVIVVMMIISFGAIFYYGEKEPVVNVLDNMIQIKSLMYGLNVDFSDMTDISLIEKSMGEIIGSSSGTRIHGYRWLSGTSKGHFKFARSISLVGNEITEHDLGDVLLFVNVKSSPPTIRIERAGEKDIYINFQDGKKTEMLHDEITSAIKRMKYNEMMRR
jgi:hypothetical protein